MTMRRNIEKFLLTEIAADSGKHAFAPDENLLDQRIIDSLGVLKLVLYLEETHGIRIMDGDIVPENFESLNSIVRLVEQKMLDRQAL